MKGRLIRVSAIILFFITLIGSIFTFPIWLIVYVITGWNIVSYLDSLKEIIG